MHSMAADEKVHETPRVLTTRKYPQLRGVEIENVPLPLSLAQDITVDLMEPPCPISTVTMHEYCLSGSFLIWALSGVNCPTLQTTMAANHRRDV